MFKNNTAEEFGEKSVLIDEDLKISMGRDYFLKNKKEIEKNYLGKYIAIIDNKVIAFSEDFSDLSKKVYKNMVIKLFL